MAIKNGKPNPLNFLDLRRVQFPARHFHYTTVSKYTPALVKKLDDWIYTNLNGRYYIGQSIELDTNKTFIFTTKIGFENDKEMSFFLLSNSNL